jgi:hypothetical protein
VLEASSSPRKPGSLLPLTTNSLTANPRSDLQPLRFLPIIFWVKGALL